MMQRKGCGSSTRTVLLLACLLGLQGCGKSLTRPTEIRSLPLVACDAQPLTVPPMVPEPAQMDSWAIQMLGLYEQAATILKASNDCLARLRHDGVIR